MSTNATRIKRSSWGTVDLIYGESDFVEYKEAQNRLTNKKNMIIKKKEKDNKNHSNKIIFLQNIWIKVLPLGKLRI